MIHEMLSSVLLVAESDAVAAKNDEMSKSQEKKKQKKNKKKNSSKAVVITVGDADNVHPRKPRSELAHDPDNAMRFAAKKGRIEDLMYWLANGARVDSKDKRTGYTALHQAAWNGRMEVVRVLLDAGADVTVTNKENERPFESAAAGGHDDIAKLLKAAFLGATATLGTAEAEDTSDSEGLFHALERRRTEIATGASSPDRITPATLSIDDIETKAVSTGTVRVSVSKNVLYSIPYPTFRQLVDTKPTEFYAGWLLGSKLSENHVTITGFHDLPVLCSQGELTTFWRELPPRPITSLGWWVCSAGLGASLPSPVAAWVSECSKEQDALLLVVDGLKRGGEAEGVKGSCLELPVMEIYHCHSHSETGVDPVDFDITDHVLTCN